jgi:hypothetical protein
MSALQAFNAVLPQNGVKLSAGASIRIGDEDVFVTPNVAFD